MKRNLALLPIIGIVLFIGLYFYSASLYPGGSNLDATTKGYDHFNNYCCDLADPTADNGESNPAYSYALIGATLLPLTLISFWYFVPILFDSRRWKRRIVRMAGCSSMLLAAAIPLEHDTMINYASALGFLAFITTLIGLFQSRQFLLLNSGLVALLFCLMNYLMWATNSLEPLIPTAQRMAYLSIFVWIWLTTRQSTQKLKSASHGSGFSSTPTNSNSSI